MRLDTLERHREATGPLQRLDARVKLIVALALIIAVIAMPIAAWRWYGGAGLFLAFIVGLSGIPPREVARRWLGLFVLVAFLVVMIAPAHPEPRMTVLRTESDIVIGFQIFLKVSESH